VLARFSAATVPGLVAGAGLALLAHSWLAQIDAAALILFWQLLS
jgi:hypothetical protein